MKFILAVLLLFSPLFAHPQDELMVLDQLIETTQKNLNAQLLLKGMMFEFFQTREAFLTNPESGKLATSLVKKATRLHNHVDKEHLSHLFSTEFLTELAFYNQVGKSVSIPKG